MKIQWSIEKLERRIKDDFVVAVHWKLFAIDGDHDALNFGVINFGAGDELITPFNELTEKIVLDWVWSKINRQHAEDQIIKAIDLKKSPSIIDGNPWSA